jgi:hypothetical protein
MDPTVVGGNLQTPLVGATTLHAGWTASRARELLAAGKFDQAPVMSRDRLVGYALLADLDANPARRVRSATRSLDQGIVLSEAASLEALLATLRDRQFAFIVGAGGISGFVTPSDLNKQAARAHFYLLIAALEIKLSDLIRERGPKGEGLLRQLNKPSRALIRRRFREDATDGIEVDYLVYLMFSQLVNIVGRHRDLLNRLGFHSRAEWRRETAGLARLRNDVMHPTREFYGPKRSVSELMASEGRLRGLLSRFEVPVTPKSEAGSDSQLTLHAAMERVLTDAGRSMRSRELADTINVMGLYRRRDRSPVAAGQITARAHRYPAIFKRTSAGVGLQRTVAG